MATSYNSFKFNHLLLSLAGWFESKKCFTKKVPVFLLSKIPKEDVNGIESRSQNGDHERV